MRRAALADSREPGTWLPPVLVIVTPNHHQDHPHRHRSLTCHSPPMRAHTMMTGPGKHFAKDAGSRVAMAAGLHSRPG